MELISCPACNKEISKSAPNCINCGHPLNSSKPIAKKKTHPFTWVVLGALIVLAISYFNSDSFNNSYKPKLPISVKHRSALLNDTRVLIINNLTTNPLKVYIFLSRDSTNQMKTETIEIAPNGSTNIGTLEGWGFKSGDKIVIKNDKYRSWEGNIP